MIKLTIGSNTVRKDVIVSTNKTPNEIIEENNVNVSNCTVHLDGAPLSANECDMPLDALGAAEGSMLIAVVAAKAGR